MTNLLLILTFALVNDNAAAPPDPFCEDVRALAEAAEEPDPFRSLRNRDFRPRLGRAHCFFSSAGRYTCGHNLATPGETAEAYASRIHACLPGSVRLAHQQGQPYAIRRRRFEARVIERGTDRAHVGRSINISIGRLARPE